MKRTFRTLISCLLIASLCIGLLSATALAAEPAGTVEDPTVTETTNTEPSASTPTGPTGTVEDPTVTETVTTDTKQDTPAPGQTTTTTTTEKTWEGRDGTEENGTTVTGAETTTETTVTGPDGSRDTTGTQTGSELTTETKTTTETKENQPSDKKTTETITRTDIVEDKETPKEPKNAGPEKTETFDPKDTDVTTDYTGAEATVTPEKKTYDATISGTADPKDALAALGGNRDMTFDENGKHTETTTGKTTDGKDVEITTVYEEVRDEDGKVISYTKTVTTRELTPESTTIEETGRTDVEGAEKPTGEREPDGDATTTVSAVVTPPQRPDPAAPVTDESGVTTETTVEEILEVVENSGSTEPQVVGYRVTTTRKGADGQLLSSKSDSVYGTITITKTVTQPMQQDTTDSVQTVSETVTRVYRQTVHTETATVTGTNGNLHAEMGNVTKGEGHGKTNMSSLQPTVPKPGLGQFDGNDLYGRPNETEKTSDSDLPYQWKGEYGLESSYRVNGGRYNTWLAHQFILRDEQGNRYYTYCADFQTGAESGWKYAMENVEDAEYYDDAAAKHIRAIAYEGYWGTDQGIGSLQNLKKILREKLNKKEDVGGLTADEIDALTDGQALTATQAAIWKYGNCDPNNRVDDDAISVIKYLGGNDNNSFALASESAKSTIQKLYNYLIAQTRDATPRTTLLDEKTIQGAKAKVASKNTDGTYNVSLDFVLAVTPDARNEDLVINVYQDNEVIGTKRLSELTGTSADGTYTIDGLKLSNNASVELRLEGTHELETGVYLYSSEVRSENGEEKTAQTFVGIASGKQTVDLRVLVNLKITDPVAKIIRSGSEQEQLVTTTQDRTCTETKTLTRYSNDVQITTTQIDRSGRSWENHWQSHWEPTPGGDQPPEEPEEPEEPETPETPVTPAVPGYDVPKTGDASGLYAILAILSALGLAFVTLTGRKRRTA